MGKEYDPREFRSKDFVERIKARDHGAVEALVKAYNKHLFYAALGLGFDSNGAEELAQNVWDTFFEIAPKFEGRSHIRTFLFGILYNKSSELRREHKKHNAHDSLDSLLDKQYSRDGNWINPPMDPEKLLLALETRKLIEDCLEIIPQKQKMAFFLKEMEGESTADICNIMHVTATNLGVLLYRAKSGLRGCLEKKVKRNDND